MRLTYFLDWFCLNAIMLMIQIMFSRWHIGTVNNTTGKQDTCSCGAKSHSVLPIWRSYCITNLHWYRQYPRSKPEFLAWIYPQAVFLQLHIIKSLTKWGILCYFAFSVFIHHKGCYKNYISKPSCVLLWSEGFEKSVKIKL